MDLRTGTPPTASATRWSVYSATPTSPARQRPPARKSVSERSPLDGKQVRLLPALLLRPLRALLLALLQRRGARTGRGRGAATGTAAGGRGRRRRDVGLELEVGLRVALEPGGADRRGTVAGAVEPPALIRRCGERVRRLPRVPEPAGDGSSGVERHDRVL